MDCKGYLKNKYNYITESDIEFFLDSAKEVLLNTLYPFDVSINVDLFVVPQRYERWIVRAAIEMIERAGISSALAYKENGMDITFDRPQISQALLNELVPRAGII